jgi:hypothetical protein
LTAAVAAGLVSMALAAGGFPPAASARTDPKHKAPIEAPCEQVAAVLSDGPDPDADPVGYAQSQILPLRRLKISSQKLTYAVDELASAYALFATPTGNTTMAKARVKNAVRAVDALCPGAAA